MTSFETFKYNQQTNLDEDYLLDSNSKERMESDQIFKDLDRRLNGEGFKGR